MDIVLVLLRLLHIVMAFTWFGLGLTSVLYIMPTVIAGGESSLRFINTLFTKTSYGMIFAVVSGTTTLAGILLYIIGNASTHFTQTGNMVLGIGALAGLAATIHGGAILGRSTKALAAELATQVPAEGQSMSASVVASLKGLAEQAQSHAKISLVLMIIALIGMGSARYL